MEDEQGTEVYGTPTAGPTSVYRSPFTGIADVGRHSVGDEDQVPDSVLDKSSSVINDPHAGRVKDAEEEISPRGVLDISVTGRSSDLESMPTSPPSSAPRCRSSHWKSLLRLWSRRKSSMRRLVSNLPLAAVPSLRRRKGTWEPKAWRMDDDELGPDIDPSCLTKPSWRSFSAAELLTATDNFNLANMIGRGGYAEVYKGCLEDGQLVAVKRLTRGTPEEQNKGFLSELGIIVHARHENVARLVGVGVEGGTHLVLQLSLYGNLATFLHSTNDKPRWDVRYQIAMGIARGVEYLHEKCTKRIIHRDLKAANVLLTENFDAQICDFGLAKWLPSQLQHLTVHSFEGTCGYLAPEYIMNGMVNEKTDVFAYGVLALELITGRRAVDDMRQSLVMWAKPLLERDDVKALIDPSLGDSYDKAEMKCLGSIAFYCIQHSPDLRPSMSEVVECLKKKECHPTKTLRRNVLQRTFSEPELDIEDFNLIKHKNDLNRLRQLAMEF